MRDRWQIGRASLVLAMTLAGATAAAEQEEYRLGPGDVLSIAVLGHQELSYREREPIAIRPDGKVSLPLMSTVEVAGKTTGEVEELITAALSKRYRHVDVAVNVLQPRPRRIYVLGEVQEPGAFDLENEDIGVREAIALAGGFTPQASTREAYLYGRDEDPVTVDLGALLSDASNGPPLRLNPGDTLMVQKKNMVAVVGEVEVPGVYEMEDGARLLDAIAAGEGLTERSDRTEAIVLRATHKNNTVDLATALAKPATEANTLLRAGDTVLIKEARNDVAVLGAVEVPGAFYAANGVGAAQAIALAGGAQSNADLTHVKLVRRGAPPQILNLQPLVERTRDIEIEEFAAAGDDVVLTSGDTLIVPERLDRVIVLGAVGRPGAYPIRPGDRVTDAIATAGGYKPGEVKAYRLMLMRRHGEQVKIYKIDIPKIVRGADQSQNYLLEDGDIIVMPSRKKQDWQYYAGVLYGIGGFVRFTYDIIQ